MVFTNKSICLLLASIWAPTFHGLRSSSESLFRTSSLFRRLGCRCKAESSSWVNRADEEVIILPDSASDFYKTDMPLFDALYNSDSSSDSASENMKHSIAQMSVREIADSYQFSLPFLGDFMVQLGCACPLDIDVRISTLLTGEQIFSVLNALNTLDAYETNAGYDSMSLLELADSLRLSKEKMLRIARVEGVNLPFGMATILHLSVVDKIKKRIDSEEEDGGVIEGSAPSYPGIIDVLDDGLGDEGEDMRRTVSGTESDSNEEDFGGTENDANGYFTLG